MEKSDPQSPVPSNSQNTSAVTDDLLQSQFQQLIQHNASATPVDVNSQISSNPHSRYSSPAPQQSHMTMPVYDHGSPYAATTAPTYSGGYQQQQQRQSYQMEPSPYPQLPDTASTMTPHNAYSTPATSPPTPQQIADGMMTRSGRAINRAHGGTPVLGPQSSRIEKSSPKPRAGAGARKGKKRRGKGSDEPAVVLDAPLSVLVKDITTVHDTNIEEYVSRTPEVRQAEVRDSKEGKVKRPMNAFMLYRKAFQNRTKEWKKHDNHQVISQVCGTSWNMEAQELRDQYDNWAKIERANHKLAFPEYKFAPAKAKNKKVVSSSRGGAAESGDEGSDLDGYEWENSLPSSRNASRASRPMYDHPDAEYRPAGMRAAYHPQYAHHPSPVTHRMAYPPPHPSSFQYSNPGKPRPAEYGASLAHNQYYQQTSEYVARPTYPHHMQPMYTHGGNMQGVPFVENVYMNKANSPAGSYHSSPVDHYTDMMGSAYPPPPQQAPIAMPQQRVVNDHHQIDPSLMAHQGGGNTNQFDALGILQELDHNDGLQQYSLDQGALGGGDHSHGQQFEQAFHQPPTHETSGTVETSWHDDPPLGKIDGDWETLAQGTDLHFEDIDGLLGTSDSPGG